MVKKQKQNGLTILSKSGIATLIVIVLFLAFIATGYGFDYVFNHSVALINKQLQQIAVQYNIQPISVPFIGIISSLFLLYIVIGLILVIILYSYLSYRISKDVSK